MPVLAVDVGGSHVKALLEGEAERRRFPSGPEVIPIGEDEELSPAENSVIDPSGSAATAGGAPIEGINRDALVAGMRARGHRNVQALLDPTRQDIDRLRLAIVSDRLWPKVMDIGANVNLGPLVGLSTRDLQVNVLIGDVFDIVRWAEGMVAAGKAVRDLRDFIGSADPTTLVGNREFDKRRTALQKAVAQMVRRSKQRFSDPWRDRLNRGCRRRAESLKRDDYADDRAK